MIEARLQLALRSQLLHWTLAIERLGALDDVASPEAWAGLERQSGTALRATLGAAVRELSDRAARLATPFAQRDPATFATAMQDLRRRYLRAETTLDFFADAINTRTTPTVASLLVAADSLVMQSMRTVLDATGHVTPPALTYIDKGLGASILKAGLRLWDRASINPVATIKVVRHNLLRPSLLHEAGHQVAHIVGWNEELASALAAEAPSSLADIWSSWASEIAADAFAFAHTGFAAVTGLRNVVDGGSKIVFRFIPGDPHPIGFIRVLLGVAMCRQFYGDGPWDDLAAVWRHRYPVTAAPPDLHSLLVESVPVLPLVAELALRTAYPAFGGRSLAQLVDPARVSPAALTELERTAGPRLYSSPYVVTREGIRLLALSGFRFSTEPENGKAIMARQLDSMLVLGRMRAAA